jgi:hypothetical protein
MGAALARATGDRRVALVASADHGHGHSADGPYGFAAESAPYDARIQELVREGRLRELADVDPAWALAAKADSFWQLLVLHGAIGEGFEPELLSYEAPTYFGMLTAAYRPREEERRPARSASHGAQEAGPQDVPEDAQPRQEAHAQETQERPRGGAPAPPS